MSNIPAYLVVIREALHLPGRLRKGREAFESLCSALARQTDEAPSSWVPVAERLPRRLEQVFLFLVSKKDPFRIGYWDDRDNEESAATQAPFWCDEESWFGDVGDTDLVSHWMPLPQPPEAK